MCIAHGETEFRSRSQLGRLRTFGALLRDSLVASARRQAEFLGLPLGEIATDHTRSELEAKFLRLLRRHRLPQPEVNVRIDRYAVDCLWRAERLIVELDGWQAHGTRSAFETDRTRDAHLKLLGFDVLRFTWRQIEEEGGLVTSTIRTLLRGAPRAAS